MLLLLSIALDEPRIAPLISSADDNQAGMNQFRIGQTPLKTLEENEEC